MNDVRIFTGNANRSLAENICKCLSKSPGQAQVTRFPDGEIDLKILEDVRGADTFIVQPTCPPVNDHIIELLMFIDCLKRASAQRVTAVMPYYGYARKDRKDEGRVPITAKLMANLLTVAGANRVLAVDLHASQIQGFFDIPLDHLFASPVLSSYFASLNLENLVVVSSDVGGIKLARAYSEILGVGLAVVDKRRMGPDRTEVGFVIGEVEGKNVVIMDDLIATAGTICEAAKTLKEKGAGEIYVGATHAVLCGPAVERLTNAPITEVVVTDTIPLGDNAKALGDRIRVLSVAPLLAEAIRRIHHNESVSSLLKTTVPHAPFASQLRKA